MQSGSDPEAMYNADPSVRPLGLPPRSTCRAEGIMPQQINHSSAQPFTRRLLDIYTGAMLTQMVEIGYRTGLFEAAAAGPAPSLDLAARAGLDERYVREWLGGMVTGGILAYDAAAGTYALPPE